MANSGTGLFFRISGPGPCAPWRVPDWGVIFVAWILFPGNPLIGTDLITAGTPFWKGTDLEVVAAFALSAAILF